MEQLNDLLRIDVFRECSVFAKQIGAINLAQGVPEGSMDEMINSRLLEGATKYKWQYVDPHGILPLRQAVSRVLFQEHFSEEEVLITSGCSESLYLAYFIASSRYGKKIGFFEPFFPNFIGLATLFEFETTPITLDIDDNRMRPNWNRVEELFKNGTRIFVLNTPHNPSGFVMRRADSLILRQLLDKYNVFLIIDYAYQYHIYDTSIDEGVDMLYVDNPNVVIAGSASKLLSATGLRVGWLLGSQELLKIAYARHLYITYSQPGALQYVASELISQCDSSWRQNLCQGYQEKRDILLNALNKTQLKCFIPDGGYFILADYSVIDNKTPSKEFVKQFAYDYGIMTIPVEPFYSKTDTPKQIRLSFSVALDVVKQASVKFLGINGILKNMI